MSHAREARPLYLMTAFGLQNPWVLWSLTRGALDAWCTECRGAGFVVRRPCGCTEGACESGGSCYRDRGCPHCRARCWACRGSRLVPGEPLMHEDFGDEESRRIADALFPGLEVDDDPRHVRMDTGPLRH